MEYMNLILPDGNMISPYESDEYSQYLSEARKQPLDLGTYLQSRFRPHDWPEVLMMEAKVLERVKQDISGCKAVHRVTYKFHQGFDINTHLFDVNSHVDDPADPGQINSRYAVRVDDDGRRVVMDMEEFRRFLSK